MITTLCFLAILAFAVNGQVFPSLLTQLGGTPLQQGFLLSSLFFLFPLSSVISGYTADRTSKRLIIILGLVFIALAFAFSALFNRIHIRILSVLLFGLGGGAVESQTSALLSDLNPDRERSIINFAQIFFSAGAAGGPFLIALTSTLKRNLPPAVFLWAAALIPVFLLMGFAVNRSGSPGKEKAPLEGFNGLLRKRDLRLFAVIIFIYVAAEMGTAGWLAKYGEVHLRLSPQLAPICITIFWVGEGLSRALVGMMPPSVSNRSLLTWSMLLTLAAQIAVFSHSSLVPALVGIGLIGFGMGCVWPTLVSIVGARFRESSGTAVGIMVAAGGLAVPLIQPILGFLSRDDLLGLQFCLLSLSIFTLVNIIMVRLALK
jgi:fucose permease